MSKTLLFASLLRRTLGGSSGSGRSRFVIGGRCIGALRRGQRPGDRANVDIRRNIVEFSMVRRILASGNARVNIADNRAAKFAQREAAHEERAGDSNGIKAPASIFGPIDITQFQPERK